MRGEVRISHDVSSAPFPVQLILQAFLNNNWTDVNSLEFSVTNQIQLLAIDAPNIAPGTEVRLQVRALYPQCFFASHVQGWYIWDARIQVETCIPDQSDPRSCL
jgi:hypothetical protein